MRPTEFLTLALLTLFALGCTPVVPIPEDIDGAPVSGPVPLNVHFRAPDGNQFTTWNMGDGTALTGKDAYHTYFLPGVYTVESGSTGTMRQVEVLSRFDEGMAPAEAEDRFPFPVREYLMDGAAQPQVVHIGDVDGDGFQDMVTCSIAQNPERPALHTFLGLGDGSFSYPVLTALGEDLAANGIGDFTLVDLNSDGRMDLAFTVGNVVLMHGMANGTFELDSVIDLPGALEIVTAELNGDGQPDFVVEKENYESTPLISDGAGGYSIAETISFPQNVHIVSTASADFDRDEVPDLAFLLVEVVGSSRFTRVEIFPGEGVGAFGDAVRIYRGDGLGMAMRIADVNNDSLEDILVGDTNLLAFVGNGDLTFSRTFTTHERGDFDYFDVADINDDGKLDAVCMAYGRGELDTYLGLGDGGFEYAGTANVAVGGVAPTVVEFESNGQIGACFVHENFAAVIDLQSDAVFDGIRRIQLNSLDGLAAGDFDNDGHDDLLAAGSAKLYWLVGDGTGDMQLQNSFDIESSGVKRRLASGDVNNDGALDFVTSDIENLHCLLAQPGGGGVLRKIGTESTVLEGLILSDVNGDALLDIAVCRDSGLDQNDAVQILPGNGDGTFGASISVPTGFDPLGICAADFDEDGIVDIAVSHGGSYDIWIHYGDIGGVTSASEKSILVAGLIVHPGKIIAADLNEDGFDDLLYSAFGGPEYIINRGGRTYEPARKMRGFKQTLDLAFVDVDGDGRRDIVGLEMWAMAYARGIGDGVYSTAVAFGGGKGTGSAMVFADFNADGSKDIAANRWDSLEIILGK